MYRILGRNYEFSENINSFLHFNSQGARAKQYSKSPCSQVLSLCRNSQFTSKDLQYGISISVVDRHRAEKTLIFPENSQREEMLTGNTFHTPCTITIFKSYR